MNDTCFMSGFERLSDLLRYRKCFVNRDRPLGKRMTQA